MGTNICIIDNLDNLIERRYTMATEAQLRAIKKWSTEKVDEIKIRVPKGQKAESVCKSTRRNGQRICQPTDS